MQERRSIIEDELFLLRDSGELPEIAYHSSIYYLTEDQDGPGLVLTESEKSLLQEAALERCREIVLRDLMPDNRDLGIYRGPQRSIYNWRRYCSFCRRSGRRIDDCFRAEVAQAFINFIQQELRDFAEGEGSSSVNCGQEDLIFFAEQIGICPDTLENGWQALCPA
ncbi:MAG: hypothetical protein SD837_00710 [Candidatus Electrothrix scaldis]|nr:MAG: hypothetical protein SD837_00710 [Candidatus Electrothrix sp. GW3-3]